MKSDTRERLREACTALAERLDCDWRLTTTTAVLEVSARLAAEVSICRDPFGQVCIGLSGSSHEQRRFSLPADTATAAKFISENNHG